MVLIFFCVVLLGATYHLVRDVLQIIGIENVFTQIGHWNHEWCAGYCDYATLPLDIFLIISSIIIVRRKIIGVLGLATIAALLTGLFMWLGK